MVVDYTKRHKQSSGRVIRPPRAIHGETSQNLHAGHQKQRDDATQDDAAQDAWGEMLDKLQHQNPDMPEIDTKNIEHVIRFGIKVIGWLIALSFILPIGFGLLVFLWTILT